MRKYLCFWMTLCVVWGASVSAFAKTKTHPPEKITGQKLAALDLPEQATDCSDQNSKEMRLCKVTSYNYLNEEVSPDGKKWGKVDTSALVLQTVGKKDLVLSAGVNWSVKGDTDAPIKERFQYLSKELEKNFGAPTSKTPPALGPTAHFQEGLQEYLQFSNENISATLIMRKKGEGTKKKISVSITFTDQSLYPKQTEK
jgi:hypothetical protein